MEGFEPKKKNGLGEVLQNSWVPHWGVRIPRVVWWFLLLSFVETAANERSFFPVLPDDVRLTVNPFCGVPSWNSLTLGSTLPRASSQPELFVVPTIPIPDFPVRDMIARKTWVEYDVNMYQDSFKGQLPKTNCSEQKENAFKKRKTAIFWELNPELGTFWVEVGAKDSWEWISGRSRRSWRVRTNGENHWEAAES